MAAGYGTREEEGMMKEGREELGPGTLFEGVLLLKIANPTKSVYILTLD